MDDYKRTSYIQKDIAKDLKLGKLKLILGAGVSMGFNFPSWEELLREILDDDQLSNNESETSLEELTRKMDTLETNSEAEIYIRKIHKALYCNIQQSSLTTEFLTNAPLLLALGAMCVGSIRGKVSHVITLNYDDILEQYLMMLGLQVNSGFNFKRDNYNSDVRVDHIHGYLPQKLNDSLVTTNNKIILSEKSYRDINNAPGEEFNSWLYNITLGYKLFLVGLSGRDTHLQKIFDYINVKSPLKTNESRGYWILTEEAYTKSGKTIEDLGFIAIKQSKKNIPKYILECCSMAIEN